MKYCIGTYLTSWNAKYRWQKRILIFSTLGAGILTTERTHTRKYFVNCRLCLVFWGGRSGFTCRETVTTKTCLFCKKHLRNCRDQEDKKIISHRASSSPFSFLYFLCSDGPDLSLTFVLDNDADENSFIFLLLYAGEKKMCSMGIKNSPSWQGNGGTYAKGRGEGGMCDATSSLLFSSSSDAKKRKEGKKRFARAHPYAKKINARQGLSVRPS